MKRYIVDHLASAIRGRSPGSVLVLVPTRQIGRNVARWLAQSGTDHANVRFDTPLGCAKRVLDADISVDPLQYADRDQLLVATYEAVVSASATAEFYFGDLTGTSFLHAAHGAIDELRNAGVSPEDVRRQGPKGETLSFMLDAYDRTLARGRVADDAAVLNAATERLGKADGPTNDLVCVLDEVLLSAAAERFVRALPCRDRLRIGVDRFSHEAPQRTARKVLSDWPGSGGDPGASGDFVGRVAERDVRVVSAFSPEREVQGVFADIVSLGIPLDTCELVYTRADYLPLIESSAIALGIECSFGQGCDASGTAPGLALCSYFSWLAGGLRIRELESLLRSGSVDVSSPRKNADERVPAYRVAELLRRYASGEGREAVERAAGRAAEADDPPWVSAASEALARFVSIVPEARVVTIGSLAAFGRRLLSEFVAPTLGDPAVNRRAYVALSSLDERLQRLVHLEAEMSLEFGARFLRDVLREHRYAIAGVESGRLYVVPLESAGYSGRKNTFVVGLDEHSFPGASHEDPILLDHEREMLSDYLPTDRGAGKRLYALERALLGAGDAITLVGRGLDPIYGKRIELTPVVEQLRAELNLPLEQYGLVESRERALSDTDAMLAQRRSAAYDVAASESYPWMARGLEALVHRSEPSLDEYSGFLGRATPELSVRGETPTSASRLEALSICPYRYFLRFVLRIRPPDDPETRPGLWLTAREFGSLLHELFFRFMTEVTEAGERPDPERHEERLLEILDVIVDEFLSRRPSPGAAAFERDRARLQRSARVFLRNEPNMRGEPHAFELRFGYDDVGGPLAVSLSDDITVRLSGSVDRVNRVGDAYEIWDYKTGQARPFEGHDLRATSEHLQWMLYAYALEEIEARAGREARVDMSGYLFVSEREFGLRVAESVPERAELAADIRPLMQLVELGAFPHYHKSAGKKAGEACRFCDYNAVCAPESRGSAGVDELGVFDRETEAGRALIEWMTVK